MNWISEKLNWIHENYKMIILLIAMAIPLSILGFHANGNPVVYVGMIAFGLMYYFGYIVYQKVQPRPAPVRQVARKRRYYL